MKLKIAVKEEALAMHVAKTRVGDGYGLEALNQEWDSFLEKPKAFKRIQTNVPHYEIYAVHYKDHYTYRAILRKIGHVDPTGVLRGEFVGYVTLEELAVLNTVVGLKLFRDHPYFAPAVRGQGLVRIIYDWLLGAGFILSADNYPSESVNVLWQRLARDWPFLIVDPKDFKPKDRRKGVTTVQQFVPNMSKPRFGAMLFGKPWTQGDVNDWAMKERFLKGV